MYSVSYTHLTHNFDAVRYAWIADYDDAATFLNNFRTGDSENTSQYSNPAYDEACLLYTSSAPKNGA